MKKLMRKAHVNITIDELILRWVDLMRGQTARSAFINSILEKQYKRAKREFDWELEGELSKKDIKEGRVKKFKSAKDAVKWLKS